MEMSNGREIMVKNCTFILGIKKKENMVEIRDYCDNCHLPIREGDEHRISKGIFVVCRIKLFQGMTQKMVLVERKTNANNGNS